MDREELKAAPEADHYIFPFANRGKPVDPERPCTNIASAWWAIRDAAGVSCRLHDLRHTYATRLLESGASDAVVRDVMGHVDQNVIRRYTHMRRAVKREAIERAFTSKSEGHVKDSPKESPVSADTPQPAATPNVLSVQ